MSHITFKKKLETQKQYKVVSINLSVHLNGLFVIIVIIMFYSNFFLVISDGSPYGKSEVMKNGYLTATTGKETGKIVLISFDLSLSNKLHK